MHADVAARIVDPACNAWAIDAHTAARHRTVREIGEDHATATFVHSFAFLTEDTRTEKREQSRWLHRDGGREFRGWIRQELVANLGDMLFQHEIDAAVRAAVRAYHDRIRELLASSQAVGSA